MSPPPPRTPAAAAERYDAVVVGGAAAGASAALLLRRLSPGARVLVVERAAAFGRKVGEATVEVSGHFLSKVLRLSDLLYREHLPKHGLRYWFAGAAGAGEPEGPVRPGLAGLTEVGARAIPAIPSFQLDRSRLDESLLALAAAEGAEVARPAKVAAVELGWPESRLEIEAADGARRSVVTRWVVDASGRHAFLGRRLRLHERAEEHPTAAVWGRWSGVADLDGVGVVGADPRKPALPPVSGTRRLATNHFCGYGWWCWAIPLAGGETSIGLVWDKSLLDPPGDTPAERYRRFVAAQPGLAELLDGACLHEDDVHAYSHLPYRSKRYAAPGWVLVGDAAGFVDPYYSPGLDVVSMSVYAAARLIEDDLGGTLDDAALGERVAELDGEMRRSLERWTDALYVGKYRILGDAELTGAAFLLDTALYYMGVVTPILRDVEELRHPAFGKDLPQVAWAARLVRAYNRRLQTLAERRRRLGIYGRRNSGWRYFGPPPGLGRRALPMLAAGARLMLRAELETLAARLGLRKRAPLPGPPAPAPPRVRNRPAVPSPD